ncbi:unnamed protein product [Paramecium primaurelia]|uniref:Uncharacterized protein n=1 Tax=Paramecium primaurelia TaxID=5886 RepID=A0A8S1M845_PARPR|nr:unnamed protein product [Paramecium primaurelia]
MINLSDSHLMQRQRKVISSFKILISLTYKQQIKSKKQEQVEKYQNSILKQFNDQQGTLW